MTLPLAICFVVCMYAGILTDSPRNAALWFIAGAVFAFTALVSLPT